MNVTVGIVVLIGVLGGMCASVQSPLAGILGQRLGIGESIFIVHCGGALAILPYLMVRGGGNLSKVFTLPWYVLIAGCFGMGIVGAVTYCVPKVGVAVTIVSIVAGQLVVGLLMDHYGWLDLPQRTVGLTRLLGVGLVLCGTWLALRG